MLRMLWVRSLKLFPQSWIKLECNVQDDWNRTRTYSKHWHVFIYLLKKEWKEVFLTLLRNTIKSIIKIWSFIMIVNQGNIYHLYGLK